MCTVLWIVLFFTLITTLSTIKILSPPSLVKYANAPSYTKFFGPQSLAPTNGTAIYFRGDECRPVEKNYEGYVVFLPPISGCSEHLVHRHFDLKNALAVVAVEDLLVPGYAHNLRFGDTKETTLRKSPMLHAYSGDLTEFIDYISRPDYAEDAIVEISLPDKNYWLDVFDSIEFFLVVRVFLPSLKFPTGIYAFYLLGHNLTRKKSTMTTTKTVIFCIEGVVMILNAIGLVVGGLGSTDNFDISVFVFFLTGFPGTEMFCSVLVALFFKSLNHANRNLTEVVDIFRNKKILMTALFIFFIALDLLPTLFAVFGSNPIIIILVLACISIIALFVVIFVIFEKIKFYVESRSKARKITGTASSSAILSVCQHTAKWMLPNVTFIFLGIIATVLMGLPLFTTPHGFFVVLSMVHFFRWGTVMSQLIALKRRYKPNEQRKSIPKWLWGFRSDEKGEPTHIHTSNTEPKSS